MDEKNKLIIFRAVTMALPVVIVLGAAEIVLRIAGPKYYRFNDSSTEYYTNPRGYHVPVGKDGDAILYGLNYRRSPEGYRLPENPMAALDSETGRGKPVLVVGDSFTWGQGVRYEDIYTTRLAKLLNSAGAGVSVKNRGVKGYDIEEVIKAYWTESRKIHYPLVIYGFVLNDFEIVKDRRMKGADFIDQNNGGRRWSALRANIATLNYIETAVERYKLTHQTTKFYLDSFKGDNAARKFALLAAMNRDIEKRGGKLVVLVFPLLYKFGNYPFTEIHDKLAEFCAGQKIHMLDLFPAFSRYRAEDLWVNPTDQHPNDVAHRIAAERLFEYLKADKLVEFGNVL